MHMEEILRALEKISQGGEEQRGFAADHLLLLQKNPGVVELEPSPECSLEHFCEPYKGLAILYPSHAGALLALQRAFQ